MLLIIFFFGIREYHAFAVCHFLSKGLKEMLEEMYCLSEWIIKCKCLLFAILFYFTLALFCFMILFIQFRNIFSVYAFHHLHYVIRIIWYWTSFLQGLLYLKIARCYMSLKERSQAILFYSKGKVLLLLRMNLVQYQVIMFPSKGKKLNSWFWKDV